MPRTKRDVALDTPTKRARLKFRNAPYWTWLSEGSYLGYRKNNRLPSWIAKRYDSASVPSLKEKKLGAADDRFPADNDRVLTYEQALEKARAWCVSQRATLNGGIPNSDTYTVADAVREYMLEFERRGKRSSRHTWAVINAHILPTLGQERVEHLTRDKVRGWLHVLVETPARRRSKKGAPTAFKQPPTTEDQRRQRKDTANRILTVLKAALNFAVSNQRVDCSGAAWREVKPFHAVAASRTVFLTVEQQQALVRASSGDFKLLVKAALYTGARYGELRRIRKEHFDGTSILVPASIAKTGKERRISLHPEAQKFFHILCGNQAPADLIFTRKGEAWADTDQHRPMRETCKLANIDPPVNFYALRHTAAANWLRLGIPSLKYVADQLGNSVSICERHYAHLGFDHRAEVFAHLPALALDCPTRIPKTRKPTKHGGMTGRYQARKRLMLVQ